MNNDIVVYLDSYSNVMQNARGGVSMRIGKMMTYYSQIPGIRASLFDKWSSKLSDCDLLHIFKATIENLAEISYAKKLGKKVVISSVIPQEGSRKIKTSLALHRVVPVHNVHSIIEASLSLADAVIAQTQQEKSFITDVYKIPESKIYVIPNGVEEQIISSFDPLQCKDIVLCVGRFDHNKNQLSLIKAMRETSIPCYFVGGAAVEEQDYFNLCKKEAEGYRNINFCGWLNNTSPECLRLYSRAKVVVLISDKEIFGNSLIEGAACGANLVATSALPTHEWGFNVENCVVIDDVHNPSKVKSGVLKAYQMDTSTFLRDQAVKLFSWKSVCSRYISIYRNLVSNS